MGSCLEEAPVDLGARHEAVDVDRVRAEMLADLPTHCAVGTKRNAKGHTISWIGYKLHLDIADGDLPISAVLTSASLHDSQVAIPLATMTACRVTNLYDLMDSAYDVAEIKAKSRALGHVPIIDPHPRSMPGGTEAIAPEARARQKAGYALAEEVRYNGTQCRRAGQRPPQGRVRGAQCVGARPRQGVLPPDVRRPRAEHRSTDAAGHVSPDQAVKLRPSNRHAGQNTGVSPNSPKNCHRRQNQASRVHPPSHNVTNMPRRHNGPKVLQVAQMCSFS